MCILYSPCLLLVAGVLYLYRWIYAEVGDALPLNGGAYNCLLNTTNKFRASMAACMTILSYMTTAVISATEAMHYTKNLIPGLPTFLATIALLALFAVLTILGITESSNVAIGIFAFHTLTLTCFCLLGGFFVARDPSVLIANWREPSVQVSAPHSSSVSPPLSWGLAGSKVPRTLSRNKRKGFSPKHCATCGWPSRFSIR